MRVPLFAETEFKPELFQHVLGPLTAAWNVTDDMESLRVPILLAHGRYDYVSPYTMWDGIVGALPDATLHLFERSGHQTFFEEPERFVEVGTRHGWHARRHLRHNERIGGSAIMARYRAALPQLTGGLFLTDGGIETTLIFHDGLELPDFAAFHLLKTPEGRDALLKYFRAYGDIARRFGTGLILESATWRANADWGGRLGYTPDELADANRASIRLLEQIREEYETGPSHVVISGCVGPRGDGYVANSVMSAQQAENYHREEIETFAGTAADMICAITMNYVEEAIGIARAAERAHMPVVLSFTVETDGRLPTGQTLRVGDRSG